MIMIRLISVFSLFLNKVFTTEEIFQSLLLREESIFFGRVEIMLSAACASTNIRIFYHCDLDTAPNLW